MAGSVVGHLSKVALHELHAMQLLMQQDVYSLSVVSLFNIDSLVLFKLGLSVTYQKLHYMSYIGLC